jgi:hypothetical protein
VKNVSGWLRLVQAVYSACALAPFIGLGVFLFDRRAGVFVMLAGVVAYFGMHLLVGIVGYRQTMRRPWPKVPPVEDDEDEW